MNAIRILIKDSVFSDLMPAIERIVKVIPKCRTAPISSKAGGRGPGMIQPAITIPFNSNLVSLFRGYSRGASATGILVGASMP